ncbi:unnamed protein product [Spirodela intermedia]|uniref:Uncharacterized protein n=1 Tax=Spirodela intermedia TaxID=51605 RepID=A0A7I8IJ33_SPIIN|nr:unnamed protein product [Spirodela intermedia]CAA6657828.1 unnamed protein product [Spirodela intermedia]
MKTGSCQRRGGRSAYANLDQRSVSSPLAAHFSSRNPYASLPSRPLSVCTDGERSLGIPAADLRLRLHGFPSWFPLQRSSHSLFHPLRHDGTGGDGGRSRRWQNLFRRLTREGKSKPHTFHYDVVSYYKNFDDGCGWERERGLLPPYSKVASVITLILTDGRVIQVISSELRD